MTGSPTCGYFGSWGAPRELLSARMYFCHSHTHCVPKGELVKSSIMWEECEFRWGSLKTNNPPFVLIITGRLGLPFFWNRSISWCCWWWLCLLKSCLDSKYCLRLGNCLSKENGVERGGGGLWKSNTICLFSCGGKHPQGDSGSGYYSIQQIVSTRNFIIELQTNQE